MKVSFLQGQKLLSVLAALFLLTVASSSNSAVDAFATPSPTSSSIQVSPVESPQDFTDLSKLRYQEWMTKEPENQRPSEMAFQQATAEIQQERMGQGAVAFLARRAEDGNQVIGAAELSPIELRGCIQNEFSTPNCRYLYVTDVVTAQSYQRQGVASALMKSVEKYSVDQVLGGKMTSQLSTSSTTKLLLHVEPLNHGALGFYKSLGYKVIDTWTTEVTMDVDIKKLTKNAGVRGQLLLCKKIKK